MEDNKNRREGQEDRQADRQTDRSIRRCFCLNPTRYPISRRLWFLWFHVPALFINTSFCFCLNSYESGGGGAKEPRSQGGGRSEWVERIIYINNEPEDTERKIWPRRHPGGQHRRWSVFLRLRRCWPRRATRLDLFFPPLSLFRDRKTRQQRPYTQMENEWISNDQLLVEAGRIGGAGNSDKAFCQTQRNSRRVVRLWLTTRDADVCPLIFCFPSSSRVSPSFSPYL